MTSGSNRDLDSNLGSTAAPPLPMTSVKEGKVKMGGEVVSLNLNSSTMSSPTRVAVSDPVTCVSLFLL